jgi:hypothetical protein
VATTGRCGEDQEKTPQPGDRARRHNAAIGPDGQG